MKNDVLHDVYTMPQWSGRWKGGRYYLDELDRPVFFIERRKRVVRLSTHDEELAVGELARFLADPHAFHTAAPTPGALAPLLLTHDRSQLYLESIAHTVKDHRAARRAYLRAWGEVKPALDLRTVDRARLREALATFPGGHAGRVEALNAFARWLVNEGELAAWRPLVNTIESGETRAEREAYSLEQLAATFKRLGPGLVRDVFHLRAATGMHYTEIVQLKGAAVSAGPLPDTGVAIRKLDQEHEIAGVLQVVHRKKHKTDRRHRVSIDADTLAAALRLREHVPDRVTVWEKFDPLVPSNLRHTFTTLAGEVGEVVTFKAAGVDRSRIAQVLGHRAGSTMTADSYDKLQVPPMIRLPLKFEQSPSRKRLKGAKAPASRAASKKPA